MKVQLSAILFILALIAGCQSAPRSSGAAEADAVTAQKDNTKFSGFLGDYSQLQPASDR